MRPPLLRWLSWRVRVVCVIFLIAGSLFPPYVPKTALSAEGTELSSSPFLLAEDGFLMKTSSIGEPETFLAGGGSILHKVEAGETVASIADRYKLNPQTVRWANGIEDSAEPPVGEEIVILPNDGVLHLVRRGETVARIAELYGVPVESIVTQNTIRNNFIIAGQQLIIPGAKPLPGAPSVAVIPRDEELEFADRLSDREIRLRIQTEGRTTPPSPAPTSPPRIPGTTERPSPAPPQSPEVAVEPTDGTLQMPCNACYATQYYHPGHYAIDLQTRGGGPIFSAEAGLVIRADTGWNGGYGNVIEIDHGNGLVTLYAHNKELYVDVGDRIGRGHLIAWMGNTGLVYGSTGIHTHFEVHVNGVKKNPLLYLE